jgi:hypothetical protein
MGGFVEKHESTSLASSASELNGEGRLDAEISPSLLHAGRTLDGVRVWSIGATSDGVSPVSWCSVKEMFVEVLLFRRSPRLYFRPVSTPTTEARRRHYNRSNELQQNWLLEKRHQLPPDRTRDSKLGSHDLFASIQR